MANVRRNVYELGSDWAPDILWYARAVAKMKTRALADPTGWRFFGGIHGFNPGLWQLVGWLNPGDVLPPQNLQTTFWNQCQHGSWYFLPWHRGYLMAIEAIMRDIIVKMGGPSSWWLPYWNYMKAGQNKLPPAFASPNWPDGTGNNPLFVKQRYGPNNDGNVYVPPGQVDVKALGDRFFTNEGPQGNRGLGGIKTVFSHGGRSHGDLETQPHDYVHGLVGGESSNAPDAAPGLMSVPDSAALDPIFYLHHCNIDRLWEVWLATGRANPTEKAWTEGPPLSPPINSRKNGFAMPGVNGAATVFTPGDVSKLSKLGYSYDDVSNPLAGPTRVQRRLQRLGVAPPAAAPAPRESAMPDRPLELLGANQAPLRLGSDPVATSVRLDQGVQKKVRRSLSMAAAAREPDRVFLNLEDVRGLNDAKRFQVYVNLPEGSVAADHPELLAGSVALFGVTKATKGETGEDGNGLDYAFEITEIVDRLHLSRSVEAKDLKVKIVPLTPIHEGDEITVGRVSVYRREG